MDVIFFKTIFKILGSSPYSFSKKWSWISKLFLGWIVNVVGFVGPWGKSEDAYAAWEKNPAAFCYVCLELAIQVVNRLGTQSLFCREIVTSWSTWAWWWGVCQTKIPSLVANSEVPDIQVATCADPSQRQGSVLVGEAGVCVGRGMGCGTDVWQGSLCF